MGGVPAWGVYLPGEGVPAGGKPATTLNGNFEQNRRKIATSIVACFIIRTFVGFLKSVAISVKYSDVEVISASVRHMF